MCNVDSAIGTYYTAFMRRSAELRELYVMRMQEEIRADFQLLLSSTNRPMTATQVAMMQGEVGLPITGICQPQRPEVLRKTVNCRIVEPLALPASGGEK